MEIHDRQGTPDVDTWHVPPTCQGQIVEYAYGSDCESRYYRRITDRSDGRVSYEWADMAALRGDWEPWNREPRIDKSWHGGAWRQL